jgi:uncharacterized protein
MRSSESLVRPDGIQHSLEQVNSPAAPMIEVIVKVAERCNLVCSYCYYFFAGDQTYKTRPGRMSRQVIDGLARFLTEGATATGIPSIKLVFHGGEPLLLRKADFEYACEAFRREISPVASLSLNVQTNGVLIDEEWVDIFRRHGVSVGISLDGDQDVNDRYRVDRLGRGTHSRVVEGFRRVKAAAREEQWPEPGLLTVLDADADIEAVYRHFVEDLGATCVSTLLPDCSHDDGIPKGHSAEAYGLMLCKLFDLWTENEAVHLREVHRLLGRFQKYGNAPACSRNAVIVVQSDGSLAMDDSYVPAQSWREAAPRGSIFVDTLADWLASPPYEELAGYYGSVPSGCSDCVWRHVCGGGDLENRYSTERGFDNPSIFCEGLKLFYLHVTRYLVRHGYPVDEIFERLRA